MQSDTNLTPTEIWREHVKMDYFDGMVVPDKPPNPDADDLIAIYQAEADKRNKSRKTDK